MCKLKTTLNYLAGLVAGDGTLYYYRRNHEYFTYVYDNNRKFLETIGRMVSSVAKVKYTIVKPSKTQNYYRLQFTCKKIFDEIKQRMKDKRAKPVKAFIRGFIDAEGSLIMRKDGSIELVIASTDRELMKRMSKWLTKRGFKNIITKHRGKGNRKPIYAIRIRGWIYVERLIQEVKPLHPKIVQKFNEFKGRRSPLP